MKRVVLVAFLCAVVLAMAAPPHGSSAAGFSGSGNGTAGDPYIITTVGQLQEMRNNLTVHYALGNDIDASATIGWNNGAGFVPVGDSTNKFTGSFDGRGFKITNLFINRESTDYVGLFGYVGVGGRVENVGLENENVTGKSYTGGIVGNNGGTVSNCYSTGSVSGGDYVGGLVGCGSASNCYSTGSVTGSQYVGGLVGSNYGSAKLENCYSTGSVTGGSGVGGLVGLNTGIVSISYSTGPVSGNYEVGGLVGWNGYGDVSNSYSAGSVSGSGFVGGLVGLIYGGTVSNSYSTGSVTGTGNNVGGLVGGIYNGAVSNSFWDTETSGQETSAGETSPTITALPSTTTGKTTEDMKNVRTYTDVEWSEGLSSAWDFVGNPYDDAGNEDVWGIDPDVNDGYPFLAEPAAPTATPTTTTTSSTPPPETPYAIYAGVISIVIVIVGLAAYLLIRR